MAINFRVEIGKIGLFTLLARGVTARPRGLHVRPCQAFLLDACVAKCVSFIGI